jgi:AGZA family xanthine/uracil permease-like MFS transporter
MNTGERKLRVPVFVGSTFEDLRDYRRAVGSALLQLGADVRIMEHFGSKSGTPVEECLEAIRSCQVYIGIFGMRYGSIPDGHDMSMIHIEYEEAQRCKLTSLIYILDESAQRILPIHVETGPGAEALRHLKEKLKKDHLVTAFTTPQNLAARILLDLPAALEKSGLTTQAGLPGAAGGDTVSGQPTASGEPHVHAALAHGTAPPTATQATRAVTPDPAESAEAPRNAPDDERATSGKHEEVGQRGYHLVYQFADFSSLSANAQTAIIKKYLNAIPQVIGKLEIEHLIDSPEFKFDLREDGGVVSFFGKGGHVFPYLLMKCMLELQETGAAHIRVRIGLHNGTVWMIQSPTGESSLAGASLIVARQIAENAAPGGVAASAAYLEVIADDLPEVKQFRARKSRLIIEGGHDIEYCKFNPSEAESYPADERQKLLDRVFDLRGRGTTAGRELVGGLSTFLVMSYIIFVQPTILEPTGLPKNRVVIATCLASALGCFLMGFLGRYPIATAPGMGQNVFFVSLVLFQKFDSGSALGVVLLAGVVVAVVAAVTRIREVVLAAFPRPLRAGIVAGIGLLITLVGLQFAGVVVPEVTVKPPYLHMGELRNAYVLVALGAVCVGLILHARGVRYALIASILIGGIGVTVVRTVVTGTVPSLPPTEWPAGRLFAVTFDRLLADPVHAVQAVFILALISLFDSVGSLLGVGARAGLVQEGNLPRSRSALLSVAAGSIAGASMGTTTIVPYVESAAGVEAGARTGLATVVTGLLFLAALPFTPLVHAFGGGVTIDVRPSGFIDKLIIYPAIAPAVIIVGSLMLRDVRTIPWDDATEALPAFLTMVVMAFTVNIMHGITFGAISYVLLKVCTGRRREVQWPLYVCAIAFFLFYVLGG